MSKYFSELGKGKLPLKKQAQGQATICCDRLEVRLYVYVNNKTHLGYFKKMCFQILLIYMNTNNHRNSS